MSLTWVTTKAYGNVHSSLMLSVIWAWESLAYPSSPVTADSFSLDAGRKRLLATPPLGAGGLATMNVTMSSEYRQHKMSFPPPLSLSFFPSFLCWRESHEAQEVDEGRLGGACDWDA